MDAIVAMTIKRCVHKWHPIMLSELILKYSQLPPMSPSDNNWLKGKGGITLKMVIKKAKCTWLIRVYTRDHFLIAANL